MGQCSLDNREIGVYTPNMEKETSHVAREELAEIERDCLCLQIRKAARLVTQAYDQWLQPSGLRSTQFNLLVAIARAGAAPLTRIADVLDLDRTTLARNLKPLESQGLVVVEPGEDKRMRLLKVTERGQQVLQEALPYWRKAQERMLNRLGNSYVETLRADLQALAAQIS